MIATMDPASLALTAAKLTLGPTIRRYITRFHDPNTEGFKEARDEMFREWLVEEKNAVAERFADLMPRVERLEEKVDARGEDTEAHGVYANYASQAYREPIAERRRMLAHAAAAIIEVRLTIAEHARVQRRIDELDPADVLTLYGLSRTYGYVFNGQRYTSEKEMRAALLETVPGAGDALIAAGCVRLVGGVSGGSYIMTEDSAEPTHPDLLITDIGRLVLRVLRTYCCAREVPFAIPGRERHPDERSREQALAVLDEIGPIRKALAAVVLPRDETAARYQAPFWNTRREGNRDVTSPPTHRGTARLDIEHLSEDEARTLARCFSDHSEEPMHGTPTERIGGRAVRQDNGEWYVRIFGPHDALRHLAEDLDIRWF